MNQPESGTAEGLAEAVPRLLDEGYRFVTLDDVVGENAEERSSS
jgi:hypothetical protein